MPEGSDPQVGQSWAYRARQTDDLAEVEVLRFGSQRPARVLVRFVGDDYEGRQGWVPPSRLKVRWDAVDFYRQREAQWNRIYVLGPGVDDPAEHAAEEVFEMLIDSAVARMEYREDGACRISDSERLVELSGLAPETWTQSPEAFHEGNELVVPWPITQKIAAATARRNPGPLLGAAEDEEKRERHRAIHGQVYRGRGGRPDDVISPEICRQVDNEHGKPRRAIIRSWCGAEMVARYDELAELRKEIHRVGKIAEEAIGALRQAGHKREADQLARKLGTPVEMLRHTES